MAQDCEDGLALCSELIQEAEDAIAELRECPRSERRSQANAVRGTLRRAGEALRHAQAAVNAMPNTARPPLRQRIHRERTTLRAAEKKLTLLLRAPAAAAREELLRAAGCDSDSGSDGAGAVDARRSLEAGCTSLAGQSEALERTERTAEASEKVGHSILNSLHRQKGTIQHAISVADETRDAAAEAGGHVSALRRVLVYNFFTQILLAIGLVLAICLVIYVRWIR
eukprot:TRINITY_DN5419_c3_g2_i2.p1 TRINITY_DN5419_c3_g2~~TRINITY_DN5419_c3_g2_i2.p1  ORF type:complete len:226 (+),score=5.48 TRINITY_DN5419_c3_g2_i2:76-753(+)